MKYLKSVLAAFALAAAAFLPACAKKKDENETTVPDTEISAGFEETQKPFSAEQGDYIKISAGNVNIRSGAGTEYKSLGVAEKDTLYKLCGKYGKWYKTVYKDKEAYIYADYCTSVHTDCCQSKSLENVIEEGCKLLGTPYVYGAVRYHNGSGVLLSGFDKNKFDCSSLMQYIFKKGASVNLQVTTRTQVFQGVTVAKSELKRGDLMFFTNSSRKNLTGTERIGHVALYLGDNYILHTASDYAKIEKISSARWGYYVQAQRII